MANDNARKYYTNMDGVRVPTFRNGNILMRNKKTGEEREIGDWEPVLVPHVNVEIRAPKEIPELRTVNTADGPKSVITLHVGLDNVARTIKWLTDRDPEVTGDTVWADVSFWEKDAERLKKALDAGMKYINVSGVLSFRDYTDKNGAARSAVQISARAFWLYNRATGNPSQSSAGAPAPASAPARSSAAPAPAAPNPNDMFDALDDDGELPFA